MNGFSIIPDEVERHLGDLAQVTAQLAQASAAGATATSMSPQAFGILCQFFTPACTSLAIGALTAIEGFEGASTKRASAADATVKDFVQTDLGVAQTFDTLRGKIL